MISGINLQNAIPSEVVSLIFDNGSTPARAWREYLQLTQEECASKVRNISGGILSARNIKQPTQNHKK